MRRDPPKHAKRASAVPYPMAATDGLAHTTAASRTVCAQPPRSVVADLALLPVIAVHCFTCPHTVRDTNAPAAHDAMERHYTDRHAHLIARLAGDLTPHGASV